MAENDFRVHKRNLRCSLFSHCVCELLLHFMFIVYNFSIKIVMFFFLVSSPQPWMDYCVLPKWTLKNIISMFHEFCAHEIVVILKSSQITCRASLFAHCFGYMNACASDNTTAHIQHFLSQLEILFFLLLATEW